MINFFRKIRKKLADDNQLFKYTRYAIGEIVLVVIGILIALQINNWNEIRKDKEQLHKYLGTLAKELSDDKESLRSSIRTNSFRVHSAQRLLELAGAKPINYGGEGVIAIIPYEKSWIWNNPIPDSLNIKFIDMAFKWVGRRHDLSSNTNTLDELKNTGMFSQMENTALKSAILNYYNVTIKAIELSNIKERQYAEKWDQSFIDDGLDIYNILSLENPLSVLKENKSRVQVLKIIALEADWCALVSHDAIKNIDELIPLIEAEINK